MQFMTIHSIWLFFIIFFSACEASEPFPFQGAVLGFGNMGQLHGSYFSKLCGKSVDIIEIDENKIKLALETGYSVYPSLEALLNAKKIDFIAICTPTYLHFDHIKEALKNSLPIFVEKPIIKNSFELAEIRKLNPPFIFVGEVEQYNPILKSAINFTPSPISISIIRSVNLDFFIGNNKPWFLNPELSGGIILDLMIHDLTLLIEKFGIPTIKHVESLKFIYPCIDIVNVQLAFKDLEVSLHADWCGKNIETPISTLWKIQMEEESREFICNDYLKPVSIEDNPYFIQDQHFLFNLKCGKVSHALEIYLQAVEIALEIKELVDGVDQVERVD